MKYLIYILSYISQYLCTVYYEDAIVEELSSKLGTPLDWVLCISVAQSCNLAPNFCIYIM